MAALALAALLPTGAAGQSPDASPTLATFEWASHGDPDDPMGVTSGVTLAPDGNLWVADAGNDRYAIIGPDGEFLEYWGTRGSGPGEFRLRRSNGDGYSNVAFAPDGGFYVVDQGNRRIQRYAPDRTYLGEWGGFGNEPGRFVQPVAVAVDADGTVLVADDVRNVVERYTADGTVLSSFPVLPPGVVFADWMTLDGNGDIYVSTCCPENVVRRFDTDGTLLSVIGSEADGPSPFRAIPQGIAIDDTGRMFVGEASGGPGDRVNVFAPDGTWIARFGGNGAGPETVGFAFALTLDGQGGLYVTDYEDGSVKKFRLEPDLTSTARVDG
jgi:sugar lactone lactonase YvrE